MARKDGNFNQGIGIVLNSTHNSILPIGGFFGLAIDDIPPSRDSVWPEWTRHFTRVSKFGTARAALIALIAALVPKTRLAARLFLRRSGDGDHRGDGENWRRNPTLGSIVSLSRIFRL